MKLPTTDTFLQRLRHSDYLVQHHRVHGICTLPGVVLLDMVYRLSASALRTQSIELRNVVFKQPIVTSEQFDIDIYAAFTRLEDRMEITVSSRKVLLENHVDANAAVVVNMECQIYVMNGAEAEQRPGVPTVDRQADNRWDMDEVYAFARKADIEHFAFMKTLGTVYRQGRHEWMELQVSSLAERHLDKFYAHAALLDGSTFAGTSFRLARNASQEAAAGTPYIPFTIERFVVYDKLPAHIYTYTEQAESDMSTDADMISRSISICSKEGKLLAEFSNLKAKRIRQPRLITGLIEAVPQPGPNEARAELHQAGRQDDADDVDVEAAIAAFLKREIARVLTTSAERIDPQAGFYELGLDSIQLLEFVKLLERKVQASLYPTLLFEYSTVEKLTQYLRTNWEHAFRDADAPNSSDPRPIRSEAPPVEGTESQPHAPKPGRPLIYEPVWMQAEPNERYPAKRSGNLPRIVVLYNESASWKTRIERQPGVSQVVALPSGMPDAAAEYRQKFAAMFSLVQQQLHLHQEGLLLQIVADANDREGDVFGLEGLLRTAVLEYPNLCAQIITLDLSGPAACEQAVGLIEREALSRSAGTASIWYRGDQLQRCVRLLKETALSEPSRQKPHPPYQPGGAYIITGGTGGLGYRLAHHIAVQTKVKLALIGRSGHDAAIEQKLGRIREKGSEAVYVQADITKLGGLEQAISILKAQWGRIEGVFHCAGTINDQLIAHKLASDLDDVLLPKIQGMWNLDQALQNEELDFFVAFSSVSAVLGNRGQSDYAGANACMDRMALQRNENVNKGRRSGRTYTINWPLWAEGGMQIDEKLRRAMYASSGLTLLPTEEGMQLLDRILSQDKPQLIVLCGEDHLIREHLRANLLLEEPNPNPNETGGQPVSFRQESSQEDMLRREPDGEDIAVIGVAGRYPKADNLDEFYRNLKEGKDCIAGIPKERWQNQRLPYNIDDYYRYGGFLNRIDDFDPLFFHISPYQAEMMDPQSRLFLQTAWEACEDAGFLIDRNRHDDASSGSRSVGVFAGVFWSHYELFSAELSQRGEPAAFGVNAASIPNMVSYHLNFHGPSMAVDSMCSSSLTAIHLACESIRRGECRYAIAGGVNLVTHPHKYVFLKQAKFLSTEGKCRSFGKDGDGYVPGEGVGAVLITTVAEAEKQGYPIYAVIKGSALNHTGRTSGATVPDPVAQSEVIASALAAAHIDPGTISYIEAHGTGTSLGDPIEMQGLERVFGAAGADKQSCAIGSVKSGIGHLEAAAGIAGLTKLLLQFRHKEIFPSLHAEELNPFIPFESTSFYVERGHKAWTRKAMLANGQKREIPLRAGISSFGANGSNAHLVMEEYVPLAQPEPESFSPIAGIVPLSAKNDERLRQYMLKLVHYLSNPDQDVRLADLAYTFQTGRSAMNSRAAFVAADVRDLVEQLKLYLESGRKRGSAATSGNASVPGAEALIRELASAGDHERIAQLWEEGVSVDWNSLYGDVKPKLLHAPTYPFARNSYWVPDDLTHSGAEESTPGDHESEAEHAAVSYVDKTGTDKLAEKIRSSVTQMAAKMLKVKPSDIDAAVELSEYGFDSILFTELANQMNRAYELELTPALFFERTTVLQLAEYLVQEYPNKLSDVLAVPATAPAPATRPLTAFNRPPSERPNVGPQLAADAAVPLADYALAQNEPIAIIGMSARFPMADDVDQFWENLVGGKDCMSEVPKDRWDWEAHYGDPHQERRKTNVKWGGFIADIDKFDPLFFGISPREADLMDPQQRLLMMYVWKAIEDAGYSASSLSGTDMGLFIGTGSSGYNVLMAQADEALEAYSITATVPSVGPNRMSYFLNVHGPSEPIETSCSSSLVAIHRAVAAIRSGDCDAAVAGGVNTILSLDAHISLNKAGMLSKDGRCKAFSEQADGYARGEGVGMIVLKKLKDAELAGDHIYGIIRGTGANHGGKASSLTAPNPKAQTALLKTAYAKANIDPATVSFIEAHGTGTPLGDPIEINALKSAFQQLQQFGSLNGTAQTGPAYCGIGSVKTNIGHLEMAAGIAGVIKVLLQMKHRKLVKSLHADKLNPYIQLEGSPFYIVRETQEWAALKDRHGYDMPRRAGVSSFGFGGSNAHVILEEYIPQDAAQPSDTFVVSPQNPVVIVLSAKTKERLQEQARQLLNELRKRDYTDEQLARIAYTLQTGREAMEARAGFIASSIGGLANKLEIYLEHGAEAAEAHEGLVQQNKEMIAIFKADEELMEAVEQWIKRRKYNKLLELWVKGLDVDWEVIYGEARPHRISLPTYPFCKESCWIGNRRQSYSAGIASLASGEKGGAGQPENELAVNGSAPSVFELEHSGHSEHEVLHILADLLGVQPDDLKLQAPLSQYGMSSILMLQLLQRLQRKFGPSVNPSDIAACGTIGDIIDILTVPSH
ncbi:SDR family NAD(P)-dependent oxidoreductase [Paenibacillus elgii]|nr:SDR family NAD(P)-dependent oxidoreductase [Paenibacillus elgii]MCM3269688.1 SDR family NAD(P)-dependent oxidoreductase [Paenibacillus elgii]